MPYVIIDKYRNVYGPFTFAVSAGEWARARWPDQEQDERQTGKGWDVRPLNSPGTAKPDNEMPT